MLKMANTGRTKIRNLGKIARRVNKSTKIRTKYYEHRCGNYRTELFSGESA
jgi:hypothetical protein